MGFALNAGEGLFMEQTNLVGCQKAYDEFFGKRGEKLAVVLDGRGGGWFRK